MTLAHDLADAEARVATLKRQIAGATCVEAGHDWKHVGGRNAGCGDECACSVPVHVCRKCEDSDYGENDEAAKTRDDCHRLGRE